MDELRDGGEAWGVSQLEGPGPIVETDPSQEGTYEPVGEGETGLGDDARKGGRGKMKYLLLAGLGVYTVGVVYLVYIWFKHAPPDPLHPWYEEEEEYDEGPDE